MLNTRSLFTRRLLMPVTLAATALCLSACGSSNNDIEYKSFSLNRTSLDTPSSTDKLELEVTWSVYTGDFGSYRMRAYAVPTSATNVELSDSNRFMERTCENPGIGRCKDPETEQCTYERSENHRSERKLTCRSKSITKAPGTYRIIGQMCTYDGDYDRQCETKETTLELK